MTGPSSTKRTSQTIKIPNGSLRNLFKRNWGFAWLLSTALLSFLQLIFKGHSGHYDIFSLAALNIWAGINPYLAELPSGTFNHSPAAALVYYSLFAFFPYTFGLALYMLSSIFILIFGLLKIKNTFHLSQNSWNFIFFMMSSELIGNILNARFETLTLGIWLIAASWIVQQRFVFVTYFLLAALCNFKLQSLPLLGLLLLFEILSRKNFKAVLYFSASFAFWSCLPLIKVSQSELSSYYASMKNNLQAYIDGAWLGFQQIFTFLHKIFQISFTWAEGQLILALIGLFLALLITASVQRSKKSQASFNRIHLNNQNILLCFGFGGVYASSLLPMSQSAAYLLYTPILIAAFYIREKTLSRLHVRIIDTTLASAFFLVSISYSDLVPKSMRTVFFDHASKSVGPLLLLILVSVYSLELHTFVGKIFGRLKSKHTI